MAHEKNLDLIVDVAADLPDAHRLDGGKLKQVLVNLIGNGIKFTPQGSIRISVAPDSLGYDDPTAVGDGLAFTIDDTGIGVPPHRRGAVFDSFTQGDGSTTRKFGGTGLGLAIADQLVRLMRGRIWIEDKAGPGARFRFVVRAEQCEPADVAGSDETSIGPAETFTNATPTSFGRLDFAAGRIILLIEDNPINRRLTESLLRDFGFETVVAEDGDVGLARINERRFDVVLLDLQMPGKSGLEVIQLVRDAERRDAERERATLIALTAHAMDSNRAECLAAGADDYLSKPIDEAKLIDSLKRVIVGSDSDGRRSFSAAQVAPPATSNELPPIIAYDELRRRLGDDPSFIRELVETLAGQVKSTSAGLAEAERKDDRANAARLAHLLSGSLGNFGARRAFESGRRLESLAKSEGIPWRSACREFDRDVVEALAELRTYSRRRSEAESIPTPRS
jgi:CheY-like chemotaxis protein/HPt (histidine-containing phosphotransfer) domain-containing protein